MVPNTVRLNTIYNAPSCNFRHAHLDCWLAFQRHTSLSPSMQVQLFSPSVANRRVSSVMQFIKTNLTSCSTRIDSQKKVVAKMAQALMNSSVTRRIQSHYISDEGEDKLSTNASASSVEIQKLP